MQNTSKKVIYKGNNIMNLNRRVQSEETGYGLQFTSTQLHVLTKSHPSGFNFLVWKYVDGTG